MTVCFLSVFAIYSQSMKGGFVFDDRNIIDHSEMLSGGLGSIVETAMSPFWDIDNGLYRPVTLVSYLMNFWLGSDPINFHFMNLVLYALTCFLIYLFIFRLSKNEKLGWIVALLFLVIPIHTEVVANVTSRSELLALFFVLLALLETTKDKINFWLVGLWVFLAIGSKESAIAIVPLILLMLAIREGKLNIEAFKKHFLIISSVMIGAGFYFFLRFFALGPLHYLKVSTSLIENPLVFTDPYSRMLTAFKVFWMYIQKLFWPVGLCSDYSYNQIPVVHNISDLGSILGLAIFIIAIILAIMFWRKKPIVTVALSMIIFSFLPVSNIIFPTGTIAGERLFYSPSLGFCILTAYVGWQVYKFIKSKFQLERFGNKSINSPLFLLAMTGFVIGLLSYGIVSFNRQKVWLNEKALFLSAVECAPESVLSRSNAGAIYYLNGDLENAKRELEYAKNIKPIYSKGLNNLGLVYWKLGQLDKAEQMYLEAIKQDFPYYGTYGNLVQLYTEEKRFQDAKRVTDAFLNLGK